MRLALTQGPPIVIVRFMGHLSPRILSCPVVPFTGLSGHGGCQRPFPVTGIAII